MLAQIMTNILMLCQVIEILLKFVSIFICLAAELALLMRGQKMLRQFTIRIKGFVAKSTFRMRIDNGAISEFLVLFQVFVRDLF